jgi:hypothetical protein
MTNWLGARAVFPTGGAQPREPSRDTGDASRLGHAIFWPGYGSKAGKCAAFLVGKFADPRPPAPLDARPPLDRAGAERRADHQAGDWLCQANITNRQWCGS